MFIQNLLLTTTPPYAKLRLLTAQKTSPLTFRLMYLYSYKYLYKSVIYIKERGVWGERGRGCWNGILIFKNIIKFFDRWMNG